MDDRQALAIVSALANGANPATGEQFAADSPYQSPNVIRALFAAQRALESRLQRSTDATPGTTTGTSSKSTSPPRNAGSANAGKPNAGKPNAGKSWSSDEDKQLLAAFDADQPLADIARTHGRTVGGVRARLEKHGRLEPSPATRWPSKEVKDAVGHSAARGGANGGSYHR